MHLQLKTKVSIVAKRLNVGQMATRERRRPSFLKVNHVINLSFGRMFSHKRKRLFLFDLESYRACHLLFIYLPALCHLFADLTLFYF